ncbi:BMP family lipoprotein [Camelimonas lactis]|nr:BMP family ABC transporter substrate-binding protein [Camelimonas lactis]
MTRHDNSALQAHHHTLATDGLRQRTAPFRRKTAAMARTCAMALAATLAHAQPAAAQQAAPPPASQPAQPAASPPAGILVVDDGVSGAEPLAGAQEAVRLYGQSGRRADLVAATAPKAAEAIRNLAQGHRTIVVIAANLGAVLEQVAKEFPDKRFILIGGAASGPNIRAITFRDNETGWLAAWLAGRLAGEGHVGFVGGPAAQERRSALCAAAQGLLTANPNALLFPDLESADVEPKQEARRGAELARGQIDRGASIIITPAGAAGAGAMETVRDLGALSVARNSNALNLFPRNVLAMQVRRYDAVILSALEAAAGDGWTAGAASVGLREQGIELRLNDAAAPPAPPDVRAALQDNVAAIISGALVIPGMTPEGLCPTPQRAR